MDAAALADEWTIVPTIAFLRHRKKARSFFGRPSSHNDVTLPRGRPTLLAPFPFLS